MTPRASAPERVLLFSIEKSRFALPLPVVEHVVRAVAVMPLPGAPDIVLGVIDFHGRIVPVINMRRRLGLPERDLALSDHFILARSGQHIVVLVADAVGTVTSLLPQALVHAESVVPNTGVVEGVLKLPDGLALLQDLEKFLSLDERRLLNEALATRESESLTSTNSPTH